jgi:hypothetical protein
VTRRPTLLAAALLLAAATARAESPPLRVALYSGPGAFGDGVPALEKAFTAPADLRLKRVSPGEIRRGALEGFDVLIQPGGMGKAQSEELGEEGRAAVRSFVAGGGGYVGVCAGAYLASCSYPWSLDLLNAEVVDRPHWERGRATLPLELTAAGRDVLGSPARVEVKYHNGPVLVPAGKADLPSFQALAFYRGEVTARNGRPGLMVGAPAVVVGEFGKGRVVGISPHPEQTAGLEGWVPRAARWAARRSVAP